MADHTNGVFNLIKLRQPWSFSCDRRYSFMKHLTEVNKKTAPDSLRPA